MLPQKWAIQVTEDNQKDIMHWRDITWKNDIGGYVHHPAPPGYITGDKYGYYLDHLYEGYTEISTETFRKEVLKQEELPTDNWLVQVTKENREEIKEWMDNKGYSYTDGYYYGVIKGEKMGYSWRPVATKCIIITTEQFRKIIMKEQSKQDFTVGSDSPFLMDAFKKELQSIGIKENVCESQYITTSGREKAYTGRREKLPVHYTLPEQWKEAIAAFQNYFAPQFKPGDIVVKQWIDNTFGNATDIFVVEKIEGNEIIDVEKSYFRNWGYLDSPCHQPGDYCAKLDDKRIKLRLATPKEIRKYEEARKNPSVELILGDTKVKVEIEKGHIRTDSGEISFDVLWNLYAAFSAPEIRRLGGINTFKLGCTKFLLNELKQVLDTYEKLNKQ